jgi:hypothetical protein
LVGIGVALITAVNIMVFPVGGVGPDATVTHELQKFTRRLAAEIARELAWNGFVGLEKMVEGWKRRGPVEEIRANCCPEGAIIIAKTHNIIFWD